MLDYIAEIERLYGLARAGLDGWAYGGASREEEQALDELRDMAIELAEQYLEPHKAMRRRAMLLGIRER